MAGQPSLHEILAQSTVNTLWPGNENGVLVVLAKKLLGTRMSSTQLGSSNYRFCCSYLVRHAVVIELQRSPAIKKRDGLVLARFALMNTSFNISGGLSDGYPQCGWRQYKVTKKPNDVCLPRPQLYQASTVFSSRSLKMYSHSSPRLGVQP